MLTVLGKDDSNTFYVFNLEHGEAYVYQNKQVIPFTQVREVAMDTYNILISQGWNPVMSNKETNTDNIYKRAGVIALITLIISWFTTAL